MTVYNAQGTTIARQTADSPLTFTAIPQVVAIRGVSKFRNPIEVTNLSSTADEYQAGILRGGLITVDIQYDPGNAQHVALLTALNSNTVETFRVSLTASPAETWTFDARVVAFPLPDFTPDATVMVSVSLRPTGATTVA